MTTNDQHSPTDPKTPNSDTGSSTGHNEPIVTVYDKDFNVLGGPAPWSDPVFKELGLQ